MLLPPPVGEVAQDAQADCDGEGNRQAQLTERASYAPILPPAGRMGQRGLLSAVFGKETRSFLHPAAPTIATESTISTISRYPPKTTKSTVSTKSRFHGTHRKPRNQRFQRNHDFTAPNGITKATKPTKKTKRPEKRRFVVFVVYGENVGFVGNVGANSPLSLASLASSPTGGAKRTAVKPGERRVRQSAVHPSQSRFARQLPRRGSQVYRRQTRQTACKAKL